MTGHCCRDITALMMEHTRYLIIWFATQIEIPCKTGDTLSIIVDDKDVEEIFFLFYRSDGSFVGNSPNKAVKAPEGAEYFCFRVQKTGITPYNAGHIAVTINGKYMTMVKSRTANLFDYSRLPTKTQGGATVTNNGDGSFTISGSGNINGDYPNNFKVSHDEIIKRFKAGKLFAKSGKVTAPYFFVNLNKDKTYVKTLVELSNKNYYAADILREYLDDPSYSFVIGINGNKNQLIKPGTIHPMLYQDGDGTYQSYKESSAMIPIDYPLYEGDKIYQKDGELWVHRENATAVFDGSEDEEWHSYNDPKTGISFHITIPKARIGFQTSLCDKYRNVDYAWNENHINEYNIYSDHNELINRYFRPPNADVNTLSKWKTWLQSNPVTVVYKLAIPTEERITAEEAYNLRTYAPHSTIWTPDDLDPEFLVDTAKNLAGAYALEGYAQAMKNKAQIEGNQEQLGSRILALETEMVKGGE